VVLEDAILGWWQNTEFINAPARLVNLSLHGCLVEIGMMPDLSPQQAVWVHPHLEAEVDWVEGVVVGIRKPLLRKCNVRIAFVRPFGYDPFKKLVYGPGHIQEVSQESAPEHERDGFWK
jgi:hypothetical protein